MMQIAGEPIRVRLKVDLTQYDKRCKIGELGKTIPNVKLSMWGSQDRFVAIAFDNGAKMDVLYKSLEILSNKVQNKERIKSREIQDIASSSLEGEKENL